MKTNDYFLTIDVGTKNLAICICSYSNTNINADIIKNINLYLYFSNWGFRINYLDLCVNKNGFRVNKNGLCKLQKDLGGNYYH